MTKEEARELAWANYEYRDGCLYSTTYHDGFNAGVAYAEGQWVRCDDRLPERKKGWNHTDEVLVWYEGGEQKIAKYGIAYYHYDPPHRAPEWVDFANLGRVPWMWKAIVRPEKGGDVDARTG